MKGDQEGFFLQALISISMLISVIVVGYHNSPYSQVKKIEDNLDRHFPIGNAL